MSKSYKGQNNMHKLTQNSVPCVYRQLKTNILFWSNHTQLFSEWEMFQTKVVQNIKTQLFKNRAMYEIMWKNIVQPEWSGHIWQYGTCTVHTGQIRHQTQTLRCDTYCYSTASMVERTHITVTLYICGSTHIATFQFTATHHSTLVRTEHPHNHFPTHRNTSQ